MANNEPIGLVHWAPVSAFDEIGEIKALWEVNCCLALCRGIPGGGRSSDCHENPGFRSRWVEKERPPRAAWRLFYGRLFVGVGSNAASAGGG